MTIYVDEPLLDWRGKCWSHMVADTQLELHAFAEQLGLKRKWFQAHKTHPHYDITKSKFRLAKSLGAKVVTTQVLLKISHKMK